MARKHKPEGSVGQHNMRDLAYLSSGQNHWFWSKSEKWFLL